MGKVDNIVSDWINIDNSEKILEYFKSKNERIDVLNGLSAKAFNILIINGIEYLYQVVFMTRDEIMRLSKIDIYTSSEILNSVNSYLEANKNSILESITHYVPQKDDSFEIKIFDINNRDNVHKYLEDNNVSVDSMDISNRAKNCLKRAQLFSMSDFFFLSREEFAGIRNMGKNTIDEIIQTIDNYILDHGDGLSEACEGIFNYTINKNAEPCDISDNIRCFMTLPDNRENVLKYVRANDIEIGCLNLSTRVSNLFNRLGYRYISDFIFTNREELEKNRSFGKKSVDEVLNIIDKYVKDNVNGIKNACNGVFTIERNDGTLKSCIKSLYKGNEFKGFSLDDIYNSFEYPEENLKDKLKKVIGQLIKDGELLYVDYRCYRVHGDIISCINDCPDIEERNKEIVVRRLNGETLESIGADYGVTRERVRQIAPHIIEKVRKWYKSQSGNEYFDNDYYRYFYENYSIEKKDAVKYLNINRQTLEYFEILRLNAGNRNLEEFVSDVNLDAGLKLRIKKYLNRNKVLLGDRWIEKDRASLERYVLNKYCQNDTSFSDFVKIYNNVLREESIYDSNLMINDDVIRTRENVISASRFVLWKQGKRLRYYDIDSRDYNELIDAIGIREYRNTEVSTLKFIRDYPEIMEEYDIRDKDELHNLLRKINDSVSLNEVEFGKMPIIKFGEFDREDMLYQILVVNSPIGANMLVQYLCDEYGYEHDTVVGSYLKSISQYYHDGLYTVDQLKMKPERLERFKECLQSDIYLYDEVKDIYKKEFPDGDLDEINAYNLKQLGFKTHSKYILKNYDSGRSYFTKILTDEDITDITDYRKRFTYVMSFGSVLNQLKKDLIVIEFEKNKILKFEKLEKMGINKEDLKEFCNEVDSFVAPKEYFTIASLKNKGFNAKLFDLGFADQFYSDLILTDSRFSHGTFFANNIFYKGYTKVTVNSFIKYLVSKYKSIDIYLLIKEIAEKYGCVIDDKWSILNRVTDETLYFDKILERFYIDWDAYEVEVKRRSIKSED